MVKVPLLPACLEPCDADGCSVLSFGTKPWINGLLVFVVAGIVSYLLDANPLLVFICNAIAIVPLSALLTDATEAIAARAGDTIGALLNITFGNLVELILLYVHPSSISLFFGVLIIAVCTLSIAFMR